jgi:hypothetical protein
MNNGNGLDLRTALVLLADGAGAYIAFTTRPSVSPSWSASA